MSDPLVNKTVKRLYGEDIEFPTEERYEVYATRAGDTPRLRANSSYLENAQALRDEWQREADENYRMEARGPVKPVLTEFFVVRVTEKREVI